MSSAAEISTTIALCVLAAVIFISCCLYCILVRRQHQKERRTERQKNGWLPLFSSPPSRSDTVSPSRTQSNCNLRPLDLEELIHAMEAQQQKQIEEGEHGCRPMAVIFPSSMTIQERQEKLHRWLSTPSCHLSPIQEEDGPAGDAGTGTRRQSADFHTAFLVIVPSSQIMTSKRFQNVASC